MKIEKWLNNEIRFIEKDGEWWAVLKDVCDALNLETWKVRKRIELGEVTITEIVCDLPTRAVTSRARNTQEMLIVNEYGIYEAIFSSKKREAVAFKKWIFDLLKELRQASGLQGFEIFRQLDKEHQKEQMKLLRDGLQAPVRVDFIKANTITNKAISTKYGHSKMLNKGDMTPQMLLDRESVLESTVEVMKFKDKYKMDISVSDVIYKQQKQ